jgi:hypothetical protein
MRDFLHALLNWIDHNRYVTAGCLALGTLVLAMTACQPTADSPFTHQPATEREILAQTQAYQAQLDAQTRSAALTYQQTLTNLQAQAAAGQAKAQAALDDIAQRKQAIQAALDALSQFTAAAGGPVYGPMIGSVIGVAGVLLGLGAAADSRRKDQVILDIKSTSPVSTSP